MPATVLASFPSPERSVWNLGPIPIRAYALCIIAGIVAAIWVSERRWVARGGRSGEVSDVAVWAVVFGLIGGRLYHVITDNELYFRAGRNPWRAFAVWEGGLGIWGAIALGGVGAWIGCRRAGIKLPPYADAAAPGIVLAQGIGRWGNYFNQELFGKPTTLPWGVEIDPGRANTVPGATAYHPTFLYESLWDIALAVVLVLVDRRFKLGRGRVFALYVMGYTAGRVWVEMLRIDTANHIFGVRLNVWTSILVFLGGLVYFLLARGPRETAAELYRTPQPDQPAEPPEPGQPAEPAEPGQPAEPAAADTDSDRKSDGSERGSDPEATAVLEAPDAARPADDPDDSRGPADTTDDAAPRSPTDRPTDRPADPAVGADDATPRRPPDRPRDRPADPAVGVDEAGRRPPADRRDGAGQARDPDAARRA